MHSDQSKKLRILRLPAVKEKTGWSRSSIYLLLSKGRFPKPISLGARAIGWDEREIDAYILNLISSRGGAK